jgi:membrane-associated phospholipid phosphatase
VIKGKSMVCAVAILLASVASARGQSKPHVSQYAGHAGRGPAKPGATPEKAPKKKHQVREAPSLFPPNPGEYDNRLWTPLANHLLEDQYAIWTSPQHLRLADADWLLPLGGITAGLLVTDKEFVSHLSNSPSRLKHFNDFSNYGAYGMVAGAGAMFLWGHFTHNAHMREAGFLSGEALISSLAATETLKYSFQRARPQDPGPGDFWNGGTSFPSGHSTAAWAIAGIIAHEYPGPLTKLLSYGLASAITISRVPAKEHFPSDVLVSTMIGYLVARHVFLAHHDPELPGSTWHLFPRLRDTGERRSPANMGSPYVPLNSWVYPAFERLAAMGYVPSAMLGMRPWTRLECVRLLEEAQTRMGSVEGNGPKSAAKIISSLEREFSNELVQLSGGSNRNLELNSLYTRVTGISGQPLTDGYHFGQTIINDNGRPYQEGFNAIAGFTGWGTAGPLVGYIQGEYQHAPSAPALPLAARQVIGQADSLPTMPALATPSVDRFRVVEGYVGLDWENWQVTAGKQNLWWGPGDGGPMMFSDNAEPVNMVQINRVTPFKLPSFLGWIGPMRVQFFIGQLGGQQFTFGEPTGLLGQWGTSLSDQPMIDGERLSFKPTPNLEFGFGLTTLFAGAGVPLTWTTFGRTLFSTSTGNPGCYYIGPGCSSIDPGDRRSGFDMTYRLPGLRNWVTFYTDSFTDDQFSPVAYFDRSANSAGLYFARLPKLPEFSLRVEGVYTDNPLGGNLCCGFYYSNDRYRNGYTDYGNLMGSWIGRDGQGAQAWLTYWESPRNSVQFQYRHQKVDALFIPYGGTLTDAGVKADLQVGPDMSVSAFLQYEKWNFPILRPGPTTDFTTSVQFTYSPHWRIH